MDTGILQTLKENVSKVIVGNERTIELLLTCILAKGHVLLEDVPGTGKTVMAKSLAKSVQADFFWEYCSALSSRLRQESAMTVSAWQVLWLPPREACRIFSHLS